MKKIAPYLFVVVVFVAGAWYFFTQEPDPVHQVPEDLLPPEIPTVMQPEQQPTPAVEYPLAEPEPEPEPEIIPEPLPSLYESDSEIKQELKKIVGAEPLEYYLVKDQAISRMVATIDSLTSRQVPPQSNPVRSAKDKFIVETVDDRMIMSERNFARYDGYVELLKGANAESVLATYQHFYPLFQQAWEEIGNQGSFNDRLIEVIDDLLATPDVPGPVYLIKPEAVYLFEDSELESLPAGQKILIRMGSANASVVKEKLVEIRARLNSLAESL